MNFTTQFSGLSKQQQSCRKGQQESTNLNQGYNWECEKSPLNRIVRYLLFKGCLSTEVNGRTIRIFVSVCYSIEGCLVSRVPPYVRKQETICTKVRPQTSCAQFHNYVTKYKQIAPANVGIIAAECVGLLLYTWSLCSIETCLEFTYINVYNTGVVGFENKWSVIALWCFNNLCFN